MFVAYDLGEMRSCFFPTETRGFEKFTFFFHMSILVPVFCPLSFGVFSWKIPLLRESISSSELQHYVLFLDSEN